MRERVAYGVPMEIVAPDVSALEAASASDILIRLYRYWMDKRGGHPLPSRADIDPLEFSFAVGRVSLVEVGTGPKRFRYRLVSSAITERLGYEMTGKYTSELPDDGVRRYVEGLYGQVIDLRLPMYEKSTRTFDHQIWKHEALLLPLSSDRATINMILVYRWTYDPVPAIFRSFGRRDISGPVR